MSSTQDNILWFRDVSLADRLAVGGKGGSLGELARAGIPIPDGFIVTTSAFNRFLQAMDPDASIRSAISALDVQDYDAVKSLSADIRRRIEDVELPRTLHDAIARACGELGETPLAVRSSATSEDSEDASFAGLQDTYLWVRGTDEVMRWVRSCWASLYSPESVSYRLRLGLPENDVAMGVVVQTMVDSRCAGVMFTRSPTTGDRSVVTLEAAWGLGSSLVSGEVTPDRYVVNKITGEINHRSVATKTVEHVPLEAGGIDTREVPAERQQKPCLSDDEIRALVETARRVETHYGSPQDIEWAIARDSNELLLLQSRPETVWATKDKAPVAKPAARAFDHVFNALGGRGK